MARATTSSVVRLNSKIENVDVYRLAPPADGTLISEGKFITYDSASKAGRLATAADLVVFLNWVDSDRSDVDNTQVAPMANLDHANASIAIETGGLAAIVGQGNMVGLPESIVAGPKLVGDYITCGAAGAVTTVTIASILPAAAAQETLANCTKTYGNVFMKEAGIIWFLFTSTGTLYPDVA